MRYLLFLIPLIIWQSVCMGQSATIPDEKKDTANIEQQLNQIKLSTYASQTKTLPELIFATAKQLPKIEKKGLLIEGIAPLYLKQNKIEPVLNIAKYLQSISFKENASNTYQNILIHLIETNKMTEFKKILISIRPKIKQQQLVQFSILAFIDRNRFDDALSILDLQENPFKQSENRIQLIQKIIEDGQFEKAQTLITGLDKSVLKEAMTMHIIREKLQRDPNSNIEELEKRLSEQKYRKEIALKKIELLVKNKQVHAAMEKADQFSTPPDRFEGYKVIAVTLAKENDIAAAKDLSTRILDTTLQSRALQEIGLEIAKQGQYNHAIATMTKISNPRIYDLGLIKVIDVMAENGHIKEIDNAMITLRTAGIQDFAYFDTASYLAKNKLAPSENIAILLKITDPASKIDALETYFTDYTVHHSINETKAAIASIPSELKSKIVDTLMEHLIQSKTHSKVLELIETVSPENQLQLSLKLLTDDSILNNDLIKKTLPLSQKQYDAQYKYADFTTRSQWLIQLATGYLKTNDPKTATELLDSAFTIQKTEKNAKLLGEIGKLYAQLNQDQKSTEAILTIPNILDQLEALLTFPATSNIYYFKLN